MNQKNMLEVEVPRVRANICSGRDRNGHARSKVKRIVVDQRKVNEYADPYINDSNEDRDLDIDGCSDLPSMQADALNPQYSTQVYQQ